MAEYIKREAVFKIVADIMCDCKVRHKGRAINRNIKQLPTADVVEVKHGHWIKTDELVGIEFLKCSVCGETHPRIRTEYCCDCGAKMDLKEGADDGC